MILTAYEIHAGYPLSLTPARRERRWMQETPGAFANRCLPLLIANQAGWWVTTEVGFSACWAQFAGRIPEVQVYLPDGAASFALSHFGSGILTFALPWLFRTPPGWNLWVRGPANTVRPGIVPLEGIVESDWSPATFTMSWKFTEKNLIAGFAAGEPICQLVPIRRGELEEWEPEIRPFADDPNLAAAYCDWSVSREGFLQELGRLAPDAVHREWQKHYFRGEGAPREAHQTKLTLKEFRRRESG